MVRTRDFETLRARLLRFFLVFLATFSAISGVLCAFLFYDLYWRWRDQFNALDRYFEPVESVVYEDDAFFWAILAVLLCALSVILYRYAYAKKSTTKKSAAKTT